jgi:hypothetical protein
MQKIITLSEKHPSLHAVLCDLPTYYRDVFELYEKAKSPSQQGFYPIHRISACLKIADMLARMYKNGFVGYITDGAAFEIEVFVGGREGAASSTTSYIGVRPMDASTWVMKAWDCGVEWLSIADQAASVATMAAIYSRIGFKRKHAFYLRQSALIILHSLKSLRLSQRKGNGEGALQCMKVVMESVGIGIRDTSNDQDDWLDEFMDDSDITGGDEIEGSAVRVSRRERFGWPALQAEVLREIIDVAEVTEGMITDEVMVQITQTLSFIRLDYYEDCTIT